ncbi:MAG: hypothetical protein ACM3ZE_25450, partial [Myxococcales bacterium]
AESSSSSSSPPGTAALGAGQFSPTGGQASGTQNTESGGQPASVATQSTVPRSTATAIGGGTSGVGGQPPAAGEQMPTAGGSPSQESTPTVQASSQSRSSRRFREALGVSTKFAQGQSQSDLEMLTDLGVRWARDTVDWSVMEPKPGEIAEFPSAFRERLEFYKAHDIGVIYLLGYDAFNAYKATDTNPAAAFDPVAFGNYAVEAAKRLRKAGVRFVLEMWNEPHNMVLRPVLGGQWNGAPPSPWVDHYLRMVKEAVARVKAYDKTIPLITNDDMWVIHYWFLEAGLPNDLDGFAFHPYVQGVPERTAIESNTDWMSPFVGVDNDCSFGSAVRRLREQGQKKLGRTPGMWITEWGWPVDQATANGTVFSEDTVAAWLPRAFVLAEAAGAETLCWFSTQDNVDGPMGLTTNSGEKRKSYRTFKTLSDTLGDFFYKGQVVGSDHRSSGTQAFAFWRDSYTKLVVWSVEPSLEWLKLEGQIQSAKITDAYGQAVTPVKNATGAAFVPIGAAAVYLDFPTQSVPLTLKTSPRSGGTPPS